MTKERRKELTYGKSTLTKEEIIGGYHYCDEWDGLVVGPEDAEWYGGDACVCGYVKPIKPIMSTFATKEITPAHRHSS